MPLTDAAIRAVKPLDKPQKLFDGNGLFLVEIDPLPSVRGCLRAHKMKHFVTMTDPREVGRLLRTIDAYPGGLVVSSALKIAPYVFVRPGELQQAKWADIDFDVCEWRYTTSKTGTPHIVPLVPQVMKILNTLYAYTGHQEKPFF